MRLDDEPRSRRGGAAAHPGASARAHRARFLQVQALDRAAPDRAPHAGHPQPTTCTDYYDVLRDNADEAQALLQRSADLGHHLLPRRARRSRRCSDQVIPQLFKDERPASRSASGCAGCATGEEAYSDRACCCSRRPRGTSCGRRSRCSAPTSTRARSRSRARAAIRPPSRPTSARSGCAASSSREGDHYRVRQELRDIVLFAAHGLLKDPPFSRVDLISCRNLLIYLDRELQEQVCSTFHYALKPGGYLLLGRVGDAPTIRRACSALLDRNARIYQSTARARRQAAAAAAPARRRCALREHGRRTLGRALSPSRGAERGRDASPGAREGRAAQHPGRRDAPGAAHVGDMPAATCSRRAAR